MLLRFSAALMLAPCAQSINAAPGFIWGALALAAVSLVSGLFARFGAAAAALVMVFAAAELGRRSGGLFALHALDAAALALLGPGAYSVDARLYGRRIIRFDP